MTSERRETNEENYQAMIHGRKTQAEPDSYQVKKMVVFNYSRNCATISN